MDLPKDNSYLIDSNLLIYSIHKDINFHNKTRRLFKKLIRGNYRAYICTQNILEAWRVLTHPKFPNPLSGKTMKNAADIWCKSFKVIYEDKSVWAEFLTLSREQKPQGNKVFDLWLAAAMRAYNIDTILTLNTKDFEDIKSIKAKNPLS